MKNYLKKPRKAIVDFFDNLALFPKYLLSHSIVVLFTASIISIISLQIAKQEMESYARASAQTVMAQTSLILEKSDSDLQKNLVAQLEQMNIYRLLRQQPTLDDPVLRLRVERQFAVMISANRWIRSVLFISHSGVEIFSASEGCENDAPAIKSFPHEVVASLHGRPYWYSGDTGRIFLSKVLYDLETTADLGMLAIGIDSSFFEGIASIDYYRGLGSVFIVSANSGQVIFHTKSAPEVLEQVTRWSLDNEELPSRFHDHDLTYLVASQITEDENWKIINIISTSELINLSARIRAVIIETTLAILLIALIMALFLVRSEVGKITTLVHQTHLIADGNFKLDVGFHSTDELGQLAAEISKMAHRLGELVEKVARERNQKTEAKLKALHFEYSALQSSINPHFIANTLEFINSYAKLYHVPQIGEAACLLGDLMRASIRHKDNLISLKDELEHCKIYLRIQELLRESTLDVEFTIDDGVIDCFVPNMILQPIVENSIIHGIEPKIGSAHIRIAASRSGHNLELSVTDDGVGIPEERIPDLLVPKSEDITRKIGLESVDKRIKILFGQSFGVRIASEKGRGTKISLHMPLIEKQQRGSSDE
ncbi:MAG TPA: histidine kinase [Spirochaetia bacterium]|nr:histidine kinase [Spirochaetia bacterium]